MEFDVISNDNFFLCTPMCEYCNGIGIIKENSVITVCPYCMTQGKVVDALRYAKHKAIIEHRECFASDIGAVLEFLPEYPVMAVLECEARQMNEYVLSLIMTTFSVLPFK